MKERIAPFLIDCFLSLFYHCMKIFSFLSPIVNVFFPRVCCHCLHILTQEERGLCAECFSRVTTHTTFFCMVCHARVPTTIPPCHPRASILFSAATEYSDPRVRALITDLKFNHIPDAGVALARFARTTLSHLGLTATNTVIVPVPLGRRRRMERGYNQCEVIATHISTGSGIPTCSSALIRTRETVAQSGLTGAARASNVADCFTLSPHTERMVSGKIILLLDDVSTTGATLTAATHALSGARPKKIVAFAVARA